MASNVNQIVYGDISAASLNLSGSDGLTILTATASESASHAVSRQYISSSAGTIKGNTGFGLKNEYYGSVNNAYPAIYGASEYVVENPTNGKLKNIAYIGDNGQIKAVSETNQYSIKRFSNLNSNFTQRNYVMFTATTGIENVYMGIGEIPSVQYIEMPLQESWNFVLRVIARKTTGLASDAFFINGFCDNYGIGTINGQTVKQIEIGSPTIVPALEVNVVFDQNGGANNYFRIECQSQTAATINWIGYLDIVSTYASASARPGGPGSI
jgi:hypothetical protein